MTQPTKPMSLQPFDPEVFQRVWNRVMPQQELSPIQPALPVRAAPSPLPAPQEPDLAQLLELTWALRQSYQAALRRMGSRGARLLNLRRDALGRELKRLSAAHYLAAGARYLPSRAGEEAGPSWESTLRNLYLLEQERWKALDQLARALSDPCQAALLEELAQAASLQSFRLRTLLEQF